MAERGRSQGIKMSKQIFFDSKNDLSFKPKRFLGKTVIYLILIFWAIICLFPIYWTVTTTFKAAPDVMKGNLVPWWDFKPKWLGLKSLGLSPDRIFVESTVQRRVFKAVLELYDCGGRLINLGCSFRKLYGLWFKSI